MHHRLGSPRAVHENVNNLRFRRAGVRWALTQPVSGAWPGVQASLVVAWLLGDAARIRRLYSVTQAERGRRLEGERDERTERAIPEERERIAWSTASPFASVAVRKSTPPTVIEAMQQRLGPKPGVRRHVANPRFGRAVVRRQELAQSAAHRRVSEVGDWTGPASPPAVAPPTASSPRPGWR